MIGCIYRYIFLLNTLSGGKSCLVAPGVAVPSWATQTVLSPWLVADEDRVLYVLSHVVWWKIYTYIYIYIYFFFFFFLFSFFLLSVFDFDIVSVLYDAHHMWWNLINPGCCLIWFVLEMTADYIYIYLYIYICIGLIGRVFANGPAIPGWVIPKAQKMVLDTTLLNAQHYYGVKLRNPWKDVEPPPTPWWSSYWKRSL